jgi:predicted nucleic acid-binding protein
MRVVVLDSGPLGLACGSPSKPAVARCQAWLRALDVAGVRVVIPEIADYEVRRGLLHAGTAASLARLDGLWGPGGHLVYEPITTDVMRLAAELWADARRAGLPTAGPRSLDADAILAAQAVLACDPADTVTVATTNVGHLARFVAARPWDQIAP